MTGHGTLVLGLGNLLMGDEGVGVHALRALGAERWPPDVSLLDGGAGSSCLLAQLRRFDSLLVIEAVEDGQPPGTVSLVAPVDPSRLPHDLARHQIGLKDLVESAALLGPLPEIELVTVSIGSGASLSTTLSPPVAAAISRVRVVVRERLAAREAAS